MYLGCDVRDGKKSETATPLTSGLRGFSTTHIPRLSPKFESVRWRSQVWDFETDYDEKTLHSTFDVPITKVPTNLGHYTFFGETCLFLLIVLLFPALGTVSCNSSS